MVAIYFVAAALCSMIHYGALELTDCICGLPVFGHHTAVIAANVTSILLKSCFTIFGLYPQLL